MQQVDDCGNTPLLSALQRDSVRFVIVEALVAAWPDGVRVNCKDHGGFTPLHWAFITGAPAAVVRYMCQACPSAIAEKDAYGHTALQHAIMSNNSDAEAAVLAVIAEHPSAVRVLCPDGAPLLKLAKDNKRVSEAIVDAITSAWPEAVAATEAAAPALVPITKGTIYLSAAGGIMGSRIAISEAARQAAIQGGGRCV